MRKEKKGISRRVAGILDLPRECSSYDEFSRAIALVLSVQWAEDAAAKRLGRPFDLGVSMEFVLKSARTGIKGIVAVERKRVMEFRAVNEENEMFSSEYVKAGDFPILMVEENGKQHLFVAPDFEKTVQEIAEDPAVVSMWEGR